MLGILDAFAGLLGSINDALIMEAEAYMARVYATAFSFIIVAIVIAVILKLAKKTIACIVWIVCTTVFWFFGGFLWLASLFMSFVS